MISKLREMFGWSEVEDESTDAADRIQMATAVLMVEMARADHVRQDSEIAMIKAQLELHLNLPDEQIQKLISAAEIAVENSVSLHDFTSVLHAEMTYDEKSTVIEMLWQIALADNQLDKYEDYMIGKIADLLYIVRGDVIRLKNRVMEKRQADQQDLPAGRS
jgi:uncharacterized tellurite resistance protein B-like protein